MREPKPMRFSGVPAGYVTLQQAADLTGRPYDWLLRRARVGGFGARRGPRGAWCLSRAALARMRIDGRQLPAERPWLRLAVDNGPCEHLWAFVDDDGACWDDRPEWRVLAH